MKVLYVGNFGPPFSTENDLAASLELAGHQVTRLQEGAVPARYVPGAVDGHDLMLWTQTYSLAERGGIIDDRQAMLDSIRALGVPTVSFHLDRWWGLARQAQIAVEPFFRTQWVFTADGGSDELWRTAGVNHHWLPPGVFAPECQIGTPRMHLRSEIAFVGSWARYGHPEWPHRRQLVSWLRQTYGQRVQFWPKGAAIRGEELRDLYASVDVVVGDSCMVGRRYWSDRLPETLGRGGFLIHPATPGLEECFVDGEHLRTWELGDWSQLRALIDYYLEHPAERRAIAEAGRAHVLAHHTYGHRVDEILRVVDVTSRPATVSSRHRRREPRCGIFGARADRRGLAVQTEDLARALRPAKVLGLDMGALSPYPNDWSGFDPDTLTVVRFEDLNGDTVERWLDGLDVVIGAETFYWPAFTACARHLGVRTALAANWELSRDVRDWQPWPDAVIAPTPWHADELPGNVVHLPHGIDRTRFPFSQRHKVGTFLHVIGHVAVADRNGTRVVLDALHWLTEPTRVVIRAKTPIALHRQLPPHVEVEGIFGDIPDQRSLYDDADVLLMPRRYGGQSLPVNEALSLGMPILMSDAPPQNGLLPADMLVRCESFRRFPLGEADMTLHDVDPRALAARMDELSASPELVERLSAEADRIAATLSWERLVPRYRQLFEQLCS